MAACMDIAEAATAPCEESEEEEPHYYAAYDPYQSTRRRRKKKLLPKIQKPKEVIIPEGPTTGVDFSGSWKFDATRNVGMEALFKGCGLTRSAILAAPKLINNLVITQSRTRYMIERRSKFGTNVKKFEYGVTKRIQGHSKDSIFEVRQYFSAM